jgi:hypothetical protein
VWGAYESVPFRHGVGQLSRHTKVSQLYSTRFCQQDVATLDVPMHLA